MKLPVIVVALALGVMSLGAQGLVNFNNRVLADINGPAIDAPIFVDGFKVPGGVGYHAALYGAVGNLLIPDSLVLLTNPFTGQGVVDFRTTVATYGYVNVGSEGARSVPGAGYGTTVTLQIRAWYGNYNSYEEADQADQPVGESDLVVISTSQPEDQDPPRLIGLQSFTIVPEPATWSLAALGLACVALLRRRC